MISRGVIKIDQTHSFWTVKMCRSTVNQTSELPPIARLDKRELRRPRRSSLNSYVASFVCRVTAEFPHFIRDKGGLYSPRGAKGRYGTRTNQRPVRPAGV